MRRLIFNTLTIGQILIWLFYSSSDSKNNSDIQKIKTKIREKDGMVMVYVPAGEFEMGSSFLESVVFTQGKLFLFPDQRPKHKVYLDAYWIDQTEVTVGMFKKFMAETDYPTTAELEGWGKPWRDGPKEEEWPKINGTDWLHPHGPESTAQDDHPVVQSSWEDANEHLKVPGLLQDKRYH